MEREDTNTLVHIKLKRNDITMHPGVLLLANKYHILRVNKYVDIMRRICSKETMNMTTDNNKSTEEVKPVITSDYRI